MIDDEVGTDWARVKEDKATDRHSAIKGYLAGGDADNEGSRDSKKTTIGTTSPRVRRLLEPFRRLHSINDLQIIGPPSDIYKAEVMADISETPPSNGNPLKYVLISLEEAISKFDSGDFASSISKFRTTLDELDDAICLRGNDSVTDPVMGRYAGFAFWDARDDIAFTVWTKLSWACLKTADVNTADGSLK